MNVLLRIRAWCWKIVVWIPRRVNRLVVQHAAALGAWASVVALIGVPLLFLGGLLTYLQIRDYLDRPDVHLFIQQPSDPIFRLVNPTTVLLREPKYFFALFDLDDRSPDGPRSLVIPTKVLEWILPKSGIGPWSIFSLSEVAKAVPTGHIVFGWVGIQCPACQTPRHYWILIKRGESTWYSEISADEWPSITRNLIAVANAGANYPALLEKLVPVEKRIRAHQEN